jgi:hypothetical protein
MSPKVLVSAAYSEKNTENYCSRQHSIGLEMEINVNGSTDEVEPASNKLARSLQEDRVSAEVREHRRAFESVFFLSLF